MCRRTPLLTPHRYLSFQLCSRTSIPYLHLCLTHTLLPLSPSVRPFDKRALRSLRRGALGTARATVTLSPLSVPDFLQSKREEFRAKLLASESLEFVPSTRLSYTLVPGQFDARSLAATLPCLTYAQTTAPSPNSPLTFRALLTLLCSLFHSEPSAVCHLRPLPLLLPVRKLDLWPRQRSSSDLWLFP